MKGPINLTCPLCEKPVYRVDHRRDFTKRWLNATIWYHKGRSPCFVIDDLIPRDEPGKGAVLFELVPVQKVRVSR